MSKPSRYPMPWHKRLWRWFYSHFEFLPILLGCWLIPPLPRSAVLWLANMGAALAPFFDRRGAQYARANINYLFPKASPRHKALILRGSYRNIVRVMLDMFWFDKRHPEKLSRWTSLSPVWHDFLEKSQPKVIVTAHHGNWEMAGHVVVSAGYPLMSVGKALGSAHTTEKLNRFRSRFGQEIVLSEGAVRPLLRTLRKGGNIALLADQHLSAREGGVWTNFMGHRARTAPTPAFFALRVPHSLIGVAYMQARPDGSYQCKTPIIIQPMPGETVERLTQRIVDASSQLIRRFPTQWLYQYKRWRDIPYNATPEEFPFYARPDKHDLPPAP